MGLYIWNARNRGGATLNSEISVVGGKTITVSIGSGGTKAKSTTALAKSATDGGETTLTYNGVTYTAPGGVGGVNSASESGFAALEGSCSYGFTLQYGVSQYYEGYYNGNIFPLMYKNGDDLRDYIFVYPDKEDEFVTSYSGTYNNPPAVFTGIGIPEFFEPSTRIYYAQPGNATERKILLGTPNDSYDGYYNSTDGFYVYQTLNPGAGGFGGTYRTTNIKYGGNGQPGIAVIRYWGYE